jgi:hypothetical protein
MYSDFKFSDHFGCTQVLPLPSLSVSVGMDGGASDGGKSACVRQAETPKRPVEIVVSERIRTLAKSSFF